MRRKAARFALASASAALLAACNAIVGVHDVEVALSSAVGDGAPDALAPDGAQQVEGGADGAPGEGGGADAEPGEDAGVDGAPGEDGGPGEDAGADTAGTDASDGGDGGGCAPTAGSCCNAVCLGAIPTVLPAIASTDVHYFDVGDVDNDGKIDIVTTGIWERKMLVYRSLGGGAFKTPAGDDVIALPNRGGYVSVRFVRLADLNKDGLLDIAHAAQDDLDIGSVLNVGGTSWNLLSPSGTATPIVGFGVGDIDDDTFPDLLVSVHFDAEYMWLGAGDGTFSLLPSPNDKIAKPTNGQNGGSFVFADLNKDGKTDLVRPHRDLATFSYLIGKDGAAWEAPVSLSSGALHSNVAVGDFDADGVLDLAAVSGDSLHVHRGALTGTTYTTLTPVARVGPRALWDIVVADIDNDGVDDIVASTPTEFVLFPGSRTSVIGNAVPLSFGTAVIGFRAADLNGDGHVDLAGTTTQDVRLWLSEP